VRNDPSAKSDRLSAGRNRLSPLPYAQPDLRKLRALVRVGCVEARGAGSSAIRARLPAVTGCPVGGCAVRYQRRARPIHRILRANSRSQKFLTPRALEETSGSFARLVYEINGFQI